MIQELEQSQTIPEGSLDRFKKQKQSRAAHSEPLKFLQHLQSALKTGLSVDIDDFAPSPPPAPGQGNPDTLLQQKVLILTADEEPKQPAAHHSAFAHSFLQLSM